MKSTEMQENDHLNVCVISIFCVSLVLAIFCFSRYADLVGTFSPPNYARVQGQIVESGVKSGNKSGYYLYVKYFYQVKGKRYKNDVVSFGTREGGDWDDANLLLSDYPVGGAVRVYYNPGDPSFSVLKPNTKLSSWGLVLIGALMCVDLAFLLWMLFIINNKRHRRRKQRELRRSF